MQHLVPIYVINLERSQDRWQTLKTKADELRLDVRRIDAVEGKFLKKGELGDFDEAGFRRCHGKIAMPAEIGCYFSHIRALRIVSSAPEPYAVIAEDDVVFTPDFAPLLRQLTQLSGWDVVKLVNHRTVAFRAFQKISDGFSIGRCAHGPSGSSAAYVVTREGAKKLLAAIRPMQVPYDVALERGWAGNYEIFTTDKPVVMLSDIAISTIAEGRSTYAKRRLPFWKRLGALQFRTTDYIRRIIYALKSKNLQ